MKKLSVALIPLFFLVSCGSSESVDETNEDTDTLLVEEDPDEEPKEEKKEEKKEERISPRRQSGGETSEGIGIAIDYGSPYVRERVIWGELVPYNTIWRAGADEATAVTFDADVVIERNNIKAGTYALFIIPRPKGDWTVILNEEWSREEHGVWGAFDYKKEKDVARIDIDPEWMGESVESLAFSVVDEGIRFEWDRASFVLPVKAK